MARFDLYFDTLLVHEGTKYTETPHDKGGPTKYGIIEATWVRNGYDKNKDGRINKEDLKLIDKNDAMKVAKILYWDKVMGDQIKSQSVAEFLFDWAYNSGPGTAIKKAQQLLPPGIIADGDMGPKTLAAINAQDPRTFFEKLRKSREAFYLAIIRANPPQAKFKNGWLNRNNKFIFKS